MTRKRHRIIIKKASGYWGRRKNLFRQAHEAVMHAGQYAYRDRRNRKREFRRLWITRISAACRAEGINYSRFIAGLTKAGIAVDRKIMAELAVNDPTAFSALIQRAGAALAG